jgi:PAS domain S-box-containing protein
MADEHETQDTSVDAGALVEQAPDAVIFADKEGTIRTWNAAAERIFGFSSGEALGQNLDIIIPERFREAHWKGFERAMDDRATKYIGQALATRSQRADGETIYVELSFAIVLDAGGTAVGALAHAREITERFNQERQQRKKLAELEKEVAELRGAN